MLRQYFRNAGIVAAAGLLLRLKPLILVPLLTRAFGPGGYGIWAQVAVLVGMLAPLLVLGTDSAILRFLPGQPQPRVLRGFVTLSWYYLLVSLGTGLALWALATPVATMLFETSANAGYVAACGLVIASTLLLNLCRNHLRAVGRARGFAALNLAEAVLTTGVCAGVVVLDGSLLQVVVYTAITDLALAAALMARGLAGGAWRDFDPGLLRSFVKFGLPLAPAAYGMWVLNQVDRLFITHYGSLEALGVYSVAYSVGFALVQLVVQPVWLMFPSTAAELHNRGETESLGTLYRQVTRVVVGLLVPLVAATTVAGEALLRVLATDAFIHGATLIPLIALAFALLNLSAYYDVALGLVGKQAWTTVNLGVAAAVNVAANFALVPALGILGAAIACAVGFGTYLGLAWERGARSIRLPFDWRFAAKSVIAAIAMTAVIRTFPPHDIGDLGVTTFAGAACYAAAMFTMRAVTRDEWAALLRTAGLERLGFLHRALGGRSKSQDPGR
jgi:O-antigen/teichoic acid export membrane protein